MIHPAYYVNQNFQKTNKQTNKKKNTHVNSGLDKVMHTVMAYTSC